MSDFIPSNTPTPIPTPTPEPIQNVIFNTIINYSILIIVLISIAISLYFIIKFLIKRRIKSESRDMIYKDFNVGRFMIVMFRKISDRYVQMDKKKINVDKQKWRFNNKDFTTFNINHIAFSDKKNNYYAFDYDTGEQLTFKRKGMPSSITIDDVDIYVNRNIIEQIVAGLEENKTKGKWLLLIIGIVLGGAIGIIIGLYLPKSGNETQIIVNATQTAHPFINDIIEGVAKFVK